MPSDVTVIILTYNEAEHIARAIASVRPFAARVVVVDSGSKDDTVMLARGAGAEIFTNPFVTQAQQFNWALAHVGVATGWILRLDADEVIEDDLAARIARELPDVPADVTGVNFKRKHIFMGRWVKHGGRYPLVMLRLFRTERGRSEDRWMDEHIVVDGGRVVTFAGGFADWNLKDLTAFIAKHNAYATREALDVLGRRYGLWHADEQLSAHTASRQAGAKRWIKEHVYNRLPMWLGPGLYLFYRTFFQLGFLDGRSGMIYHVLQGFWYRYLVAAKVYELDRALAPCPDADARRQRLFELTGFRLPGEVRRNRPSD